MTHLTSPPGLAGPYLRSVLGALPLPGSRPRTLADREGRLPVGYVQAVSFRRPVLLPGTVAFSAAVELGGLWALDLRDTRTGAPHLTGTVEPGPTWPRRAGARRDQGSGRAPTSPCQARPTSSVAVAVGSGCPSSSIRSASASPAPITANATESK